MSAFIVDDSTINGVLAFFKADCHSRNGTGVKWILREAGYDIEQPEVLRGLGYEMFRLNIYGVDARYGEGEAEKFRPLDYEYKFEFPKNIFQAVKSLQCLIYQCSEGDVVERPLYKLLRECEFAMCRHIVGAMPAYEAATWG